MASTAESYVFGDTEGNREFLRLRQIETLLDPASWRVIQRAGPRAGSRCLEVGAGAGSIASGLADRVGPSGSVVALDVDPRFLGRDRRANVEIVRHDIRSWGGRSDFDLVHARYVLIHMPDPERALEQMVASLKPGGWVALEEPDFLAARFAGGEGEFAGAFQRVNAALEAMFRSRGIAGAAGSGP
ncbi:MAG: methyltransferase domain-containing protein [Myxococcota bacterium]|nr:methyltransferase domain-containing protein [Myxococcota bacterium]